MHRLPLASALCAVCLLVTTSALGGALPPQFQETPVFTGLDGPTAVQFARDGRVFIAEKRGIIKVFPNLQTNTPTVFVDIRTAVHNFWDRGLLGMALHPNFPTTPYVYVLYTLDRRPGGPIPSWGVPGADYDDCPTPPGPTTDGCVVSGRLSRFVASGNVVSGAEQVLIEDWCQQFSSHSIGSLVFGADGALYVTGGDGAGFVSVDYGQLGGSLPQTQSPGNACGDPPGGVGGTMTPPSAEGGALRSQSLHRASGGPVVYGGTVLRLDPETGAAYPNNPLIGSPDVKARRVIAEGLRNPFRAAWRPGANELWVGDVGWQTWEEINRIPSPTTEVRNFGWPCYEGGERQLGYDAADLAICENLYARVGSTVPPVFQYGHAYEVTAGDGCGPGSSSISGLAFHPTAGPYPAPYRGALFFTDYSRRCIWVMPPDSSGTPDPSQVRVFAAALEGGVVALETGPSGELYYVDIDLGRIVRVEYFSANTPPTAVLVASPESGIAPLTVRFDASGSSDPDGQRITFAWDLDGDGRFDDGTDTVETYRYRRAGNITVRLRVTDTRGASDTTSIVIAVGNSAPVATISTPTASTTWRVGSVISFSGRGTDSQQGTLPASALTWTLVMHHCPSDCHQHVIREFVGVSSGSFTAPDHEYPSFLELRLTVTDAGGLTDAASVELRPRTVTLTFDSSPTGLQLGFNNDQAAGRFTRTVIVGSVNSVSAPSPQTLAGRGYTFARWSDGGGRSHTITAPSTATTYVATFNGQPTVSVGDVSRSEGDGSLTPFSFTIRLSSATTQDVVVNWTTASGSATSPADFVAESGWIRIPAGQTARTVVIDVVADNSRESNETFELRLQSATNATIADGRALGVILNDD